MPILRPVQIGSIFLEGWVGVPDAQIAVSSEEVSCSLGDRMSGDECGD